MDKLPQPLRSGYSRLANEELAFSARVEWLIQLTELDLDLSIAEMSRLEASPDDNDRRAAFHAMPAMLKAAQRRDGNINNVVDLCANILTDPSSVAATELYGDVLRDFGAELPQRASLRLTLALADLALEARHLLSAEGLDVGSWRHRT